MKINLLDKIRELTIGTVIIGIVAFPSYSTVNYFKPGKEHQNISNLIEASNFGFSYSKIEDINTDILKNFNYCIGENKIAMSDFYGNKLSKIQIGNNPNENQEIINKERKRLSNIFSKQNIFSKPTDYVQSDGNTLGYPFAIACNSEEEILSGKIKF